MIQKDKLLLLKDICARLPYGVKTSNGHGILELSPRTDVTYIVDNGHIPYLRSINNMTEEEFKEYHSMLIDVDNSGLMNQGLITKIVDWLDKKMFDHRNLLPKGLALEAPAGIYKTE